MRKIWRSMAASFAVILAFTGLTLPSVTARADTPDASTTTTLSPSTTTSSSPPPTSTVPQTPVTTPPAPPAAPSTPTVDLPPLVNVQTMVKENDVWGVLLDPYRKTPLPGCLDVIPTKNGDAACFYPDHVSNPNYTVDWVQLVVLKRQDLSLVDVKELYCPQATTLPQEAAFDNGTTGGVTCTAELSNYIAGLNSGDLVIAVNQPDAANQKNVMPPVGVGAVLGSVGSNHGIGITSKWYNEPDHGAHLPNATRGTVSAIGVPGWQKGGVSLESDHPDQQGSGALSADLALNNAVLYSPVQDSTIRDEAASPVNKVVFQSHTPWPKATEGQQAAFSALGIQVGLGGDPRAQYYSGSRDNADWVELQRLIDKQHYEDIHPTPSSYTAADFAWAKTELDTEIGYVVHVNSYMGALSAPYRGASSAMWATFGQVVDAVNSSTSNGTSAKVTAIASSVINAVLEAAHSIPVVSHVAAVVAGAYHLALEISNTLSEPSDEPFSTQAADLGKELQTRLDDAQAELGIRFRNIIVADYGKLKTVADCSASLPSCTDNSDGWSISVNDNTHMETVLKLGLERELYETLVPAKYTLLMQLGRDKERDNNKGKDVIVLPTAEQAKDLNHWCRPIPPFDNSTGDWVVPSGYTTSSNEEFVRVYVLTNDAGPFSKWEAASKTVFDRMFSPINDQGDFGKGGLGINEDSFMRNNYFNIGKFAYSTKFLKWYGCGPGSWYTIFGG